MNSVKKPNFWIEPVRSRRLKLTRFTRPPFSVRSEAYRRLLAALVQLRVSKSLSQADLAALVGKPASFVGKYELGERRLDVVEVFVLLRAQGENPARFLAEQLVDVPERLR